MRALLVCLGTVFCLTHLCKAETTTPLTPTPEPATRTALAGAYMLNVRDFAAEGDGSTDDTHSFQNALDACERAGGGTVYVPPARYNIEGHLSIPPCVTLRGSFESPPTTTDKEGSTLLAFEGRGNANGTPFITLQRNATLMGIQVFYPKQTRDIVPYPWCVRANGDNTSLQNVLLVNPYQAADFGSVVPAGRHYINGLYAHALKTGLFVDKCYDVGRVENVHFWPFWTTDEKVMDWTKQNGTAFIIGRTDWEYMNNCFAISYNVGYHFVAREDGPGNAILTQCGSDIGPLAVKVDEVQSHSGVSFLNSQFMAGVQVSEHNTGPVKFTACGFWGYGKTDWHALLAGQGQVTYTACHFTQWGQVNPKSPAIIVDSGSVTINGCDFLDNDNKVHIELMPEVQSAIITNNHFQSKPQIINNADGEVVLSGNIGGKPSVVQAALDKRDQQSIARYWEQRKVRGALTSSTQELRLASAVLLTDRKYAPLRQELLKSVVDEGAGRQRLIFDRAKAELSQSEPKYVAPARRTTTPPVIDGKLDEAMWKKPASVVFPANSTTGTSVWLAWDDNALYLAAHVQEPAINAMKTTHMQHDTGTWLDDNIELFLAPHRAIHRYLQLIINAEGSSYDGVGTFTGTSPAGWESNADIKTVKEAGAWTVEAKMPWKNMGEKAPRTGDQWSVDFRHWRYAGGGMEQYSWAGVPFAGPTHHPEAFGLLEFK